jgi:hypothetical protein
MSVSKDVALSRFSWENWGGAELVVVCFCARHNGAEALCKQDNAGHEQLLLKAG